MSHPLLVEAAETSFVPAIVHNNTDGDGHAEILKRYREPSWNNPVVRIVDPVTEKDLVPRWADDWTVSGAADLMVRALEARQIETPAWLRSLRDETASTRRGLQTAIFGMT